MSLIDVRKLCYQQKFKEAVALLPNAEELQEMQGRDKHFVLALYRCSQRFESVQAMQAEIEKNGFRQFDEALSDTIGGNFVIVRDPARKPFFSETFSLRFVGRGGCPRPVTAHSWLESPEAVLKSIETSPLDFESQRVIVMSCNGFAPHEEVLIGDNDPLKDFKLQFAEQYQAWRDNPDISGLRGEFVLAPAAELKAQLNSVYNTHSEYSEMGFEAMVDEFANDDFYACHDAAIQYQVAQERRKHQQSVSGPTP